MDCPLIGNVEEFDYQKFSNGDFYKSLIIEDYNILRGSFSKVYLLLRRIKGNYEKVEFRGKGSLKDEGKKLSNLRFLFSKVPKLPKSLKWKRTNSDLGYGITDEQFRNA